MQYHLDILLEVWEGEIQNPEEHCCRTTTKHRSERTHQNNINNDEYLSYHTYSVVEVMM